MSIRIYFLSFGNEKYYNALKRIEKQARDIGLFTDIFCYTDKDLQEDESFWNQHGQFVVNNPRGYGYWIWKPYLVLKQLEKMDDNDILVYADAGCDIIPELKPALVDALYKIMTKTQISNVAVEMNREFCIEKKWTKMNLFKMMECEHLKDTYQYHATYFILKKCDISMKMVQLWYDICYKNNYIYLTDELDPEIPNDPDFNEHRHDQSIFSLIRKQNPDSTYIVKQCTTGHFIVPSHNETLEPMVSNR